MSLKISNKKRESVRFPFCLMAESEGLYYYALIFSYNLLRINTMYLLYYEVSIICSNNYIVLLLAKLRRNFGTSKYLRYFFWGTISFFQFSESRALWL